MRHVRKDKDLHPISREEVEVDGTYTNEWGREEYLKRGEEFPFDPQKGSTEWRLAEYDFENHHRGMTDERLVPKRKVLINKLMPNHRAP